PETYTISLTTLFRSSNELQPLSPRISPASNAIVSGVTRGARPATDTTVQAVWASVVGRPGPPTSRMTGSVLQATRIRPAMTTKATARAISPSRAVDPAGRGR